MRASGRDTALKVLRRVEADQAFAAAVLASELKRVDDPREAGLAFELVYGVLRMRPFLDHLLERVSDRGLRKLNPEVMDILRVAAYQIAFLERIPARAAVHHAVERTRRSRASRLSGLVNALLRRLSELPDAERRPTEGVRSTAERARDAGLPVWLYEKLTGQLGEARTAEIAAAFNHTSRRTLRVNVNRLSREEAVTRLGDTAVPGSLSPWAVHVDDAGAARRAVEAGWAVYQDEAAQLAVLALAPQPGERILDACAGRGGKSGAVSMMTGNGTRVVAADRSEGKLQRLSFELERQGFEVSTVTADLTAPPRELLERPFDRVLLDAPCSGTGTLGRRPEIRWRLRASSVESLCRLQQEILKRCAAMVAPGGRLLYVVCSILQEEGIDTVARFLKAHPDFTRTPAPPRWPAGIPWRREGILIDPSKTKTDGYQIISLQRAADAS